MTNSSSSRSAGTVYDAAATFAARGESYAVATVVRTEGSTPQVVGARMIVAAGASAPPAGTLGGGCVEGDAITAAREVIRSGGRRILRHQLTEELAWNTGLVCGGTMWILVERGDDAWRCGDQDVLPAVTEAARGGSGFALVTMFARTGRQDLAFAGRAGVRSGGAFIGAPTDPTTDERIRDAALEQLRLGTPRVVALGDGRDALIEPVADRPRLIVAGGGHVARAIARQARLLDFDVTVVEDRPAFADPERFDEATVLHGPIVETIGSLDYGDRSWLVVATRGHKLDADCVLAAVKTSVRYIGLLGSRRKTRLVEDMLRAEGVSDDRIAVVHAPVGLDLGGRTPAEIALAVMAEITQLRYGGTGRPLRALADHSRQENRTSS
jgi:xanthine dehydrogenase accessory factor